jgi:hypothetical protein
MLSDGSRCRVPAQVSAVALALLGLIGYFGPWIPHKAAALVLTGVDLAEYVKFLPEVRSGTLSVPRELFYLPLFSGSLLLVLLASDRGLAYPWPVRWLMVVMSVPVALFMLPPAWTPQLMQTPEFRVQAVAILVCVLVAASHALLRRSRPILLRLCGVALALAAAIAPVWQFLRVRPLISNVYNKPLAMGWGPYLTTVSFALIVLLQSWLGRLIGDRTRLPCDRRSGAR